MPQAVQPQINPPTGATPPTRPGALRTPQNDNTPGATPPTPANDNTPQQKPHQERITTIDAIKLIATGVLFDLIALIPVVGGYAAEFIGGATFLLWFAILGLPLMSVKSVANWFLNLVVGETATAGVWPGFTIGAIITVVMVKAEDKTGLDIMSMAKGKVPDISAVKDNLSQQIQNRFGGNKEIPGGATPNTSTKDTVGKTPEENPVTASQREHFADPSTPAQKGATPPTRNRPQPQAPQATTKPRANDEEVYSDPYREDPYASSSEKPRRDVDALPSTRQNNERPEAFPGTSPQFGRGSRYEERISDEGGRVLPFNTQRTPRNTDETPQTGATPRPVNDDVS